MNNWKTVLTLAMVAGVVAATIALNAMVELSAIAMFMLIIAMGFAFYVVWDVVLFKHVDTRKEIIDEQNIAYAITLCIPALLVLAASLVK